MTDADVPGAIGLVRHDPSRAWSVWAMDEALVNVTGVPGATFTLSGVMSCSFIQSIFLSATAIVKVR